MEIVFHFDPSCPWTWVTSRWLVRAAEVEDLEVRWAPFSLTHLNEGQEDPMADTHAAGVTALRVVQHLLDVGDHDAVGRYYEAFGELLHRQGRAPSPDLATEAAKDAGLDGGAIAAADDPSHDAAIAAATDTAFEAAGPDIGSPVLHWREDGGADVWIFGPLFDCAPAPACAAELWRGVRHLAVHPMFKELKRGRSGEPDLAST